MLIKVERGNANHQFLYLKAFNMIALRMLSCYSLAVFVLSARVHGEYFAHHSGSEGGNLMTNEWLVRVEGGEQVAQLLALEAGCIYGGKVILLKYFSLQPFAK